MAGSKLGGMKARNTNYERHGRDFYKKIGAKGGRNGTTIPIKAEKINSKPYDKNPKYTILSDGNIVLQNGRFARLQKDSKGYLRWQAHLGTRDDVYTEKVHRVIARHFLPNPENKPQVNHIDGDKTNNNVSNLEWCDNIQNMEHAIINGLVDNSSKVMNELGGQIAEAVIEGYIVKEIAKKNGISEKTIRRRVWEFEPEPITTLRLGRKRKYYYYDKSRNKYRVEASEIYPGKQFDTEQEAKEYIESFYTGGGFAANPELARMAGRKGGKASQRGESHKAKLEENSQVIRDLLKAGASYKDISRAIEVPYGSTRYWIKKNLEIYDEVD